MPRVKSVFEVSGVFDGFDVKTPLRLKLTVISGGVLLGRVTTDTPSSSDFVLDSGKANLDLFASTEKNPIYTCQFSLIKYDDVNVTIVDCAARVCGVHGLVGRWNESGLLGKADVCDHAFEMKVVQAEDSMIVKSMPVHTNVISSAIEVDEEAVSVSRKLLLQGNAVDQNGYVYATILDATLHTDGSVTGVSTETGKRCKLVGTWSGTNVTYTIDYLMCGTVTHYNFRGVLETNTNGMDTLSGTWKYEKQSPDENGLYGGFEFCAVDYAGIDTAEILPGEYVFTGAATSDSNTKYDAKVTLNLLADGALTGKSEELSIAPQVCELKGSWDNTNRTITYRMIYTNGGTGSYEYVGQLHGQQLTGRWVNPRAADRDSERGHFEFTLTSFEAAQATTADVVETVTVVETSSGEHGDVGEITALVPGEYVFTGAATSDSGTEYDAKVTLALAADGTLTGTSKELSIAPQTCELTGVWNNIEKGITYTMTYTNGCTATYEYKGQVHDHKFTGRWENSRVKDLDGEKGDFTFSITSFTPFAIQVVETSEDIQTAKESQL